MKYRATVFSTIVLALLFAAAATSAQTFTELHTYPIGSGAGAASERPK